MFCGTERADQHTKQASPTRAGMYHKGTSKLPLQPQVGHSHVA